MEIAQVGYNAILAEIMKHYQLKTDDTLDLESGVITRKVEP